MAVPPVATVYHLYVPPDGVPAAVNVTVPVPHLEDPVTVGAVGNALTVTVAAVLELTQPAALTASM